MKKILLSIVLLSAIALFTTNTAVAQSKNGSSPDDGFHFNVGGNIALPLGNFSNAYSIGFGGFVGATKAITDEFVGFGQIGYDVFSGKTIDGFSIPNGHVLSIQAGAKYLISDGFAIGAGIGYGSYGITVDGVSASTGGFYFAPVASYDLTANLSIIASYNSLSVSNGGSLSFFKAGVAYKF